MPIVSVLMPVRDGAAFLEDAVSSILGQTLDDLELLVVDDGSRDETPALLALLARGDRRLRVVRQNRLGIVPALQRGLAAARADLIARMDADDIAAPERLHRQVAVLADPAVALVGSACEIVDRDNRLLRVQRYPASPAAIRRELVDRNCIAHPTVVMRRAAVMAVGGYRAPFAHCEDYDLWLRLSEHHDLVNLEEPLLRYRLHGAQSAWQAQETRILSELGAVAAGRLRRAGEPEPMLPEGAIDRAFLRAAGMSDAAIAGEVRARAMRSARDATVRGLSRPALAALTLALRRGGPGIGWRLRAASATLARLTRARLRRR